MSNLSSRARLAIRYLQYRLQQEGTYFLAISPAARYLHRSYLWWRHTFPEFVLPAPLPDPPDAPPACARRPPAIVPADALRRKLPVWERQLDNVLLFGHSLPTTPEVDYRKSYLAWVAGKPQSRGWLPTSRIAADADTVSVPVYQYPFVHDAWMRQRLSTQRHSLDTAASTAERQQVMRPNFVHVTDEHGKLHVLRPQMLLLPQTTLAEAPAKAASEQAGGQEPAASTKAEASQADIKAAQQALREAWQDASSAFGSGRSGMTAVQPRLLAFAQGRVQTFRDAMSEFMDGYSEGTKQVESGQVDMIQDTKAFWATMMHTLPQYMQDQGVQPKKPTEKERADSRGGPG